MHGWAFTGVLAAVIAGSLPARGATPSCFSPGLEPDARVAACTGALAAGTLPDETRALALTARAQAFSSRGRRKKALADYDAAIAITPQDVGALVGRGRLREEADDASGAESDYSAAIAADPTAGSPLTVEAFARRGALRMARGDDAGGLADFGEARRLNPRDPIPFKIRGAYLMRTGDIRQAIAELSAAIALQGDDADALVRRATGYARVRDYPAAVADFTAALAIQPDNAAALEGRGVARLQSGMAGDAIADFSRLIDLRPGDITSLFFRASAKLQAEDMAGADRDFTAVLAHRRDDREAFVGRATAREFLGDYAGAERDLAMVIAAAPTAAALGRRGHVRMMAGAFADAADDFAAAMALPDAPADLALWRFVAERRAGRAAGDILEAALETLNPTDWPTPIFRYLMGELSGNALLAAADAAPANTGGRLCEAYYYLGQAALLAGEQAEAVKLFKAAVATGMTRYTEHAAAKAEVTRLNAGLSK